MDVAEAHALISRAIEDDRMAHGYLVVGDIEGSAGDLTERILKTLFPTAPSGDDGRLAHPDIVRLDPEGRSGQISVGAMRDQIVVPMSQTAYSGGWKIGVITGADRLNESSANAFLKSLEEPPPKTAYFLLTDRPESILPTIVSRCQRIDLTLTKDRLEGEDYESVAKVFACHGLVGTAEKAAAARHLATILKGLKDNVPDEKVAFVRKLFFKTVSDITRKWMTEGLMPRRLAFANIEAVEQAFVHCDRNSIPEEMVLVNLFERLTFPA